MKRIGIVLAIVALAIAASWASAETAAAVPAAHSKVFVCHATGSETNPYVGITVNVNSVGVANDLNGHAGHELDAWASFDYAGTTYPGQGDAAFVAAGCSSDGTPPALETGCVPYEDGYVLATYPAGQAPEGSFQAGTNGYDANCELVEQPCTPRGDRLHGLPICPPDPLPPPRGTTGGPTPPGTTGGTIPTPTSAAELPFTGFDAWVAFVAAGGFLAAGLGTIYGPALIARRRSK